MCKDLFTIYPRFDMKLWNDFIPYILGHKVRRERMPL